jgi:arginyl-tRNA synthetase
VEHPLVTLASRFQQAIRTAFGDEVGATDPALRRSAQADFQADVALSLAKKLQRPPRDVAQAIAAGLDLSGIASRVEVAGPGFVNVVLDDGYLARVIAELAAEARLGVPTTPSSAKETVVIDYSAPNVAKEMHVGNMRSTILGDALSRVFEELGHRVIRQNHLGDWGTPFGMLIEHLVELEGQESARDAAAFTISDLDAFYREARAKFDGDPAFAERSRLRVVQLQGGDETTLALWKRLVDESRRYFAKVYERLGVRLRDSDVAGESLFNPMLHDVVEGLRKAGILRESDGAQCAFPPGFSNKEGAPLPVIVQKQDGGFGYAATDLAALRYRIDTLGATRILYVVGAPQQQHFAMVFAVAKEAGWLKPPVVATHVFFGSVLGPDKKMFKTRSGGAVKLIELLDEAKDRATALVTEKNPELEPAVRSEVGRVVGIGAVKYADLSSDRVKDYVFDWNRMLAFEGNTAPYLQYAHARIRSIFRRPEALGSLPADPKAIVLREPQERALALALLGFGASVVDVADTLQPHRLCTYLYDLATTFTRFYETCPVLRAEDEAVRRSRLALADVTARVLARGLDLLGIEAPHRM